MWVYLLPGDIAQSIHDGFAILVLSHCQHVLNHEAGGISQHPKGVDNSVNLDSTFVKGPEPLQNGTGALWGTTLDQSLECQRHGHVHHLKGSRSQDVSLQASELRHQFAEEAGALLALIGLGQGAQLLQGGKGFLFGLDGALFIRNIHGQQLAVVLVCRELQGKQ